MRTGLRVVMIGMALCALGSGGLQPAGPAGVQAAAPVALLGGAPALHGDVIIPVSGVEASQLKDSFNDARDGHVHHAIDIMAPRGTPVVAAVNGKLVKFFSSRAGGLTIYQFDRDEHVVYYYAHLDAYAPSVWEGKAVQQGEVIGYVGTTGNAPANTPHLHFSIELLGSEKQWWRTEPIDPYPILTTPASALPARLSASR